MDPLLSPAAAVQLVRVASAGVVVCEDGGVAAMPGLRSHSLLAAGSPSVATRACGDRRTPVGSVVAVDRSSRALTPSAPEVSVTPSGSSFPADARGRSPRCGGTGSRPGGTVLRRFSRASDAERPPTDRVLRAASITVDPGEDDDPGQDDDAPPPASTPELASRIMLTRDDLLWVKTSQDAEGRITLGPGTGPLHA